MRGLSGRVVLVPDAAGGIGAATAKRLAREGARTAVADLNLERAKQVAANIGGDAAAFEYDQGEEESVVALVRDVATRFGALHGLHANAPDLRPELVGRDRQVAKMEVTAWERTLRVNFVGYAVLVCEVLPHMLEAGGGAIVCTSSAASELGQVSNLPMPRPKQVSMRSSGTSRPAGKHNAFGPTRSRPVSY
jgi:NAD(P)-dependent dehydrogenase (short-subunit alcohol dehydrogenase family)